MSDVTIGNGNGTYNVNGGQGGTISVGNGNDTVVVTGGSGQTITIGNGNDSLTVNGATGDRISAVEAVADAGRIGRFDVEVL